MKIVVFLVNIMKKRKCFVVVVVFIQEKMSLSNFGYFEIIMFTINSGVTRCS